MAAEVAGKGTSFEVGRSQSLFAAPVSPFAISYDVTPDGKRFPLSRYGRVVRHPLVILPLNKFVRVL